MAMARYLSFTLLLLVGSSLNLGASGLGQIKSAGLKYRASPAVESSYCTISNECGLEYSCVQNECVLGCDGDDRCNANDTIIPHNICSKETCIPGCRDSKQCNKGRKCERNKCTSCKPGLLFEFYKLFPGNGPGRISPNFDYGAKLWASNQVDPVLAISGQQPDLKGTVQGIGGWIHSDEHWIYGQQWNATDIRQQNCVSNESWNPNPFSPRNVRIAEQPVSYSILVHYGFLKPEKAWIGKSYNFRFQTIDDGLWLWVGQHAISGYTWHNADFVASWHDDDNLDKAKYSIHIGSTDPIPIRMMWGQSHDDWVVKTKIYIEDEAHPIMSSWNDARPPVTDFEKKFTDDQAIHCSASIPHDPPPLAPAVSPWAQDRCGDTQAGLAWELYDLCRYRSAPHPCFGGSSYGQLSFNYDWDHSPFGQFMLDVLVALAGLTPLAKGVSKFVGHPLDFVDPGYKAVVTDYVDNKYVTEPIDINEMTFIATQYVGYFKPRRRGTYTFTLRHSDESSYMWLGDHAISNFSVSNADIKNVYHSEYPGGDDDTKEHSTGPYKNTITYNAKGKEVVPIRILNVNAQSNRCYWFRVTGPANDIVMNSFNRDGKPLTAFTNDEFVPCK